MIKTPRPLVSARLGVFGGEGGSPRKLSSITCFPLVAGSSAEAGRTSPGRPPFDLCLSQSSTPATFYRIKKGAVAKVIEKSLE